jgi:tyrosinase
MQPIAQSVTDTMVQARLVAAAAQWRLPYWDWAINQSIPAEFASPTIQVLSIPDGDSTVSITNPFYAYKFNPIDPSFASLGNDPNFEVWQTTLRQPTSSTSPRAKSQENVANSQLAGEDFKQLILDLFPTTLFEPDPWGQFSNHSWNSIPGDQGTLTSLEGIHDMVHVDVGGAGHMGNVPVAAFDPIFWLHHCQVDRLFCLWQAVYPTVYVSPGPDAARKSPTSIPHLHLFYHLHLHPISPRHLYPFFTTLLSF